MSYRDSYIDWRRAMLGPHLRGPDLFELVPEWRDVERAKREASWLIAYLVGAGMSYKDAGSIGDPERIKRARDALVSCLKHPERDSLSARR